MTSYC